MTTMLTVYDSNDYKTILMQQNWSMPIPLIGEKIGLHLLREKIILSITDKITWISPLDQRNPVHVAIYGDVIQRTPIE